MKRLLEVEVPCIHPEGKTVKLTATDLDEVQVLMPVSFSMRTTSVSFPDLAEAVDQLRRELRRDT